MPVFRYAEVLLNYAEAKAELGTLTQNDLAITVNEIRSRVGNAGPRHERSQQKYRLVS